MTQPDPSFFHRLGGDAFTSPGLLMHDGMVVCHYSVPWGDKCMIVVLGLEPRKGQQRWRTEILPESYHLCMSADDRPGAGAGVIYVTTNLHKLCALDARTGVRLEERITFPGMNRPAVFGNMLVISTDDGLVEASRIDHGRTSRCWVHNEWGKPASPPAIGEGAIVVACKDVILAHALSGDKQLLWSRRWPESFAMMKGVAPVIANGLAFLASPMIGRVHAFALQTGALRWATSLHSPVAVTPVHVQTPGGGVLCCATANGLLHVLDAATGRRKGFIRLKTPVQTHIETAGPYIYFGTAAPWQEIWRVNVVDLNENELVREVFRGGTIAPHIALHAEQTSVRVFLVTREHGRDDTHFVQMLWFDQWIQLRVFAEQADQEHHTRLRLVSRADTGAPLAHERVHMWAGSPVTLDVGGKTERLSPTDRIWARTDERGELLLEYRGAERLPPLHFRTESTPSGASVAFVRWEQEKRSDSHDEQEVADQQPADGRGV